MDATKELAQASKKDYADLFNACAEGDLEKCKELMDSRVFDIETKNDVDETPLLVATKGSHLHLIDYLLEKGANIEQKGTEYVQTPLMAAALYSTMETFHFLEARGADMTARDIYNADVFMRAVDASNLELMKYLLSVGEYDLERRNTNGFNVWTKAAKKTSIEVKKYLVELGVDIHAKNSFSNENAMALSARYSDAANCQYLHEIGVSSKVLTIRGETPLHVACIYRNVDIVKFLLENKLVNINATTKKGLTAFDIASKEDWNGRQLKTLLMQYSDNRCHFSWRK